MNGKTRLLQITFRSTVVEPTWCQKQEGKSPAKFASDELGQVNCFCRSESKVGILFLSSRIFSRSHRGNERRHFQVFLSFSFAFSFPGLWWKANAQKAELRGRAATRTKAILPALARGSGKPEATGLDAPGTVGESGPELARFWRLVLASERLVNDWAHQDPRIFLSVKLNQGCQSFPNPNDNQGD